MKSLTTYLQPVSSLIEFSSLGLQAQKFKNHILKLTLSTMESLRDRSNIPNVMPILEEREVMICAAELALVITSPIDKKHINCETYT